MWQRIQTVFLAIVASSMLAMLFFPVWEGTNENGAAILFPMHLNVGGQEIYSPYFSMSILAVASVVVSIIAIGKFKNRLTQIKLGALNSLLLAGCLVLTVVFIRDLQGDFTQVAFGYGLYLPVVAMISNSFANRFIRRDERLVRESDRLR